MTPLKVCFTGLEIVPSTLEKRVEEGIIPEHWHYYCFEGQGQIGHINQWLANNIEGRWAIIQQYTRKAIYIVIAFELDHAAAMFVLSDGPRRCLLE